MLTVIDSVTCVMTTIVTSQYTCAFNKREFFS